MRVKFEFHLIGCSLTEKYTDESSSAALDEFLAFAKNENRIAILEVEVPDGERERINITMPRYVLKRIDAFAGALNRTRSAFLSEAALAFIRNH